MSKKISEMTPAASLSANDIVPIVDSNDTNKTVTGAQIKKFVNTNTTFTQIINQSAVSVPNNTPTNVTNFTLNKGVWILHVVGRFSGASAGNRHMSLHKGETAPDFYGSVFFTEVDGYASGDETVSLQIITFVDIPADNSPVYVRCSQTNAQQTNVNVTPRVQYFKLADD